MNDDCTILLLEDEPLILMDLELAARDHGCRCLIATTVEQALGHLGAAPVQPDVAVLDVTLQDGETCLPVARELKRLGIPYILHSGDLERQNEQIHALDARLVPKPASSSRVIEVALQNIVPSAAERQRAAR
ncbi:MAG: response regulator [Tsuneonella sp.]